MIKNIPHSVQARLMNLSRASGVAYQQIVTRYLQERLLSRLSQSVNVDNFILKGGALLYAHVGESARPTLDLDFMGEHISREKDSLLHAFKEIYRIDDADGVEFDGDTLKIEEIAVDKKYPGVRLSIVAKLGTIRQVVSMDVGFGDVVVPSPVELDYPSLLENGADIRIKAYSVETVIAEKLQTMVDRYTTNSRMKDFYDVRMLLDAGSCDVGCLSDAISATFANRKTSVDGIKDLFESPFVDNRDMALRWDAYARKTKLSLPSFPEVMESIRENLAGIVD